MDTVDITDQRKRCYNQTASKVEVANKRNMEFQAVQIVLIFFLIRSIKTFQVTVSLGDHSPEGEKAAITLVPEMYVL